MQVYWKIDISLLLAMLLILLSNNVFGDPKDGMETPWDTVMAKIQVIESMGEPDSVKNALTQQLFSDFQLTAEDYRRFYSAFLKEPPEKKTVFLKQVEEILLKQMSREYNKRR